MNDLKYRLVKIKTLEELNKDGAGYKDIDKPYCYWFNKIVILIKEPEKDDDYWVDSNAVLWAEDEFIPIKNTKLNKILYE